MWSYGCRPKDRRKNKGTSQWSLGCPNGKSWHIQYLMAWDIQSDDLIPIPILLPVNVDPLTRRPNLQTRQEECIVTTIVSPYTKGWYDEGEATKKVGKVWEYQPDSGAISKTSKTWCYRSCFAVPTWLSGGTSFSDHPSQVPLPSVPFLFLTWIWSWRNWIGMIQGWLSYRMFPWLETTFPIWGQPRQGGQPMSWTCQVETSPCLTGYPQHGTFGQRDHQLVLGWYSHQKSLDKHPAIHVQWRYLKNKHQNKHQNYGISIYGIWKTFHISKPMGLWSFKHHHHQDRAHWRLRLPW